MEGACWGGTHFSEGGLYHRQEHSYGFRTAIRESLEIFSLETAQYTKSYKNMKACQVVFFFGRKRL